MAYNVRVDLRVHDESALLQVELSEVLLASASAVHPRGVDLRAGNDVSERQWAGTIVSVPRSARGP